MWSKGVAPAWGEELGGEGAAEEGGVGGFMEVEADDVEDFYLVFVAMEGEEFVAGGDHTFL